MNPVMNQAINSRMARRAGGGGGGGGCPWGVAATNGGGARRRRWAVCGGRRRHQVVVSSIWSISLVRFVLLARHTLHRYVVMFVKTNFPCACTAFIYYNMVESFFLENIWVEL